MNMVEMPMSTQRVGKKEAQSRFPLPGDQFWQTSRLLPWKPTNAKIVAVMNKKGGCGKTKTAVALGAYIASKGYKVLFWDMDEQQSLTRRMEYAPDDPMSGTFSEWVNASSQLQKNVVLVHPAKIHRKGIEFCIIPAGPYMLGDVENRIGKEQRFFKNPPMQWFENLVTSLQPYFDYIIFDTGPSRNDLHKLVSAVAQEIIVPFDGLEAFEGVGDLHGDMYAERTPEANALLAMVKWQPDKGTKRKESLAQVEVFKAARRAFPGMVCDNGVYEKAALKKDYTVPPGYSRFDPGNEYLILVNEILERWSDPTRPNFFNDFNEVLYKQQVEELRDEEVRGRIRYAYNVRFGDPPSDSVGGDATTDDSTGEESSPRSVGATA